MKRRTFVEAMGGAAAQPLLQGAGGEPRKTISIQFGAVSLIDEGVERVLDIFQERAAVNALVPAVFSFSSGTAGRQSKGQPLPDHGRQEYDTSLRGGNFARVHPQYSRDTAVDPKLTQAPDPPHFDVLGDLLPAARKRGMKIFGLIQDHFPEKFPNVEKFQERDFNGAHCETLCKNNPYYRNFLAGLVEDLTRSYDIDGLMFVCEHTGAFSNTLGSRLRGKRRGLPGTRGCFCEFCREKARKQGIRFDRVLAAFTELEKFVAAGRAQRRPVDGYYVTLWRLMLKYPELLMWEHFFHEGVREAYRLMHQRIRSVRREAQFGLHIWHNFTLSPLYRAERDLSELANCCDFFKVALYHNCGGPRMATYIDSVGETIYGDVPPGELLQFHSGAHQLAGSYFINKGEMVEVLVSSGNLPWTERVLNWQQQNLNARETWAISPTAVNQFQLSFVRHIGGRLNTPQTSLGDFGSSYQMQGPKALPRINVRGYFNLYTAIAGPLAGSNYYQVKDLFTLTRGRHSLKLGFEEYLEKTYQMTEPDNYGRFDFRDGNTGDSYADFLLGLAREIRQDAPVYKTDSGWYTGMFVQDKFRVHLRLMLNLGLRYEIQFPLTDPQDRKNTFQPGAQSKVVPTAPLGMLFPGDPGISRAIIRTDKNNLAPRVGLAGDPSGDGKTSVRAGFGVYYGSMGGNMANGTADRPPFTLRYVFARPGTLSNPYLYEPGGRSPFPYYYNPANPVFYPTPISMKGRDPSFRWRYTYQLNFSIQRQVLSDLSVTAAYVSSLSHKLPTDLDLNYPVFGPGATASNYNARRPYKDYTDITVVQFRTNAAYHGLQLSADKRMSRNFSFKGYYTFGKGLEDLDLQSSSRDYPQNSTNYRLDRGRTSNDRRHRLLMSGIWQLDYLRGASRLVRGVLNGWTAAAIVSFLSGDPFSVGAGNDINLDGQTNDRANLIGDPRLDPNRPRSEVTARWFNTAAFVAGQPGQEGTSGRNILDSPGIRDVDLGLFRDFPVREGWSLQFRAELTNAFNLVNFGNPQSAIGSAAFGSIRSAGDMRRVQLGLRLTY